MSILNRIFQVFRPKPRDLFPACEYVIKEAFIYDGVRYFKFDDSHNIPCERALQQSSFYMEMSSRVDREYLATHIEEMEKEFLKANNGQKPDLYRMKMMNDYLKARMNIIDIDLMYKLASIVYFDEHEDPRTYDAKYNAEKIAKWKKSSSVNDFFSSAPLLKLMPFLKELDVNLDTYSKATEALKDQMLTNITRS